jgi:DNA-binding MarR family transcriptional regulator
MQRQEEIKQIVLLILSALDIVAPAVNKSAGQQRVSFTQTLLLAHIGKIGELTMTDISRWCGYSTAAATGTVDRLEKLGYVERIHAADDRRKVRVRLTESGTEFVQRFTQLLEKEIASELEGAEVTDVPAQLKELSSVFAWLAA